MKFDIGYTRIQDDVSIETPASFEVPFIFLIYSCTKTTADTRITTKYGRMLSVHLFGLLLEQTESGTYKGIGTLHMSENQRKIGEVLDFLGYPDSTVVTIV